MVKDRVKDRVKVRVKVRIKVRVRVKVRFCVFVLFLRLLVIICLKIELFKDSQFCAN